MEWMNRRAICRFSGWMGASALLLTMPLLAQQGELPRLPREQWGAPLVTVSHAGTHWIIAGRTQKVTLDETDTGQFVSLKEKIAREPLVAQLIGTPHVRQHALRNYKPGGHRFDPNNPDRNYRLTTFDELAKQLREMKARGIERAYVTLAGWPYMGYDRQHPDVLPPAPAAGGWEGLKRWVDTCKELGYLYNLHDQYRDYYVDAPSYDPQFAVHEEDAVAGLRLSPAPGSGPGRRATSRSWITGTAARWPI